MFKNIIVKALFFSAIIVTILFCPGIRAQAEQQGDYIYAVIDGKVEITEYTGAGGAVDIPNTLGGYPVTSISYEAFYRCTDLTSVTIPSSVTNIGDKAFYCCTDLTSITIPQNIINIGLWAFAGCSKLTSITVDANNNNYTSVNGVLFNKDRTILIQCPGGATNIIIPESVTTLADSAFESCYNLTSITIPQGVDTIECYAFYDCAGLTSITIPEGVTSIGNGAFDYCSEMTSITFNSSNTTIYDSEDTIPDAAKITGYESSTAEEYATKYGRTFVSLGSTPESDYAYIIKDGEAQITGYTGVGGAITIPSTLEGDSVTSIGDSAFASCYNLTSITIPEGVTSIGNWAFCECTGLTSISIPEGVTSIGNGEFFGCTGLTSISIPDSVTSIGEEAFYDCTGLTSITIPEGVMNIGSDAFDGCTGLTSIRFNSATTTIYDNAYTIPTTTKIIGYYLSTAKDYATKYNRTFEAISSTTVTLESITITTSATKLSYIVNDNLDITGLVVTGNYSDGSSKAENITSDNISGFNSSVAATDQVLTITVGGKTTTYTVQIRAAGEINFTYTITNGKAQITGYTGIGGNVEIPGQLGEANVTGIGNWAFYNSSSLTSIIIPQGVTSIGHYAFKNCTKLTNITMPDGLKSIGDCAFDNCTSLTSIIIPEGVTSIGESTFLGCSKLTNITIPESVTSIGHSAFYNCTSLTSINIPQGVTSIGDFIFEGCTSLTSVIIPSSLTNIGRDAFLNCKKLQTIQVDEQNTTYSSADGVLYDKVKKTLMWYPASKTGKSFSIPEWVTSVGDDAFHYCTILTNVIIPESTTGIGSYAFHSSGLTSVTIPNSVTNIGNGAFWFCVELTFIMFNSETTTIYDSADTIPDSTKIIGYNPSTAKDYATKYNRTFQTLGSSSATLESIAITAPANKLIYAVGDDLDITGLVVIGSYSDSGSKIESITSDNISGFDSSSAVLSQVLTITVGGKTTTYTVQITAPVDECFIATAAFGSKFQPAVVLLRHFRDQYLLTNGLGTKFVKFYYRNSPPIAVFIAKNETLKALVRVLLMPFIAFIYLIYHPILGIAFIGVMVGALVVLLMRNRRKVLKLD